MTQQTKTRKKHNINDENLSRLRNNRKRSGNKNRKNKFAKYFALTAAVMVGVCALSYCCYGYIRYNNRFLPETFAEGINCGNMSAERFSDELINKINEYSFDVKKNGEIIDTIKLSDIGGEPSKDIDDKISDAIDSQNKLSWGLRYISSPLEVELGELITINDEKFNAFIEQSKGYNLPATIANKAQSVEFKEGKFVVGDAVYGDEIDKDAYKIKVKENMLLLNKEMELRESECYTKPKNSGDRTKYEEACNKANELLNYGSLTIKADGLNDNLVKEIADNALIIDDSYNVTFNEYSIKSAVDAIIAKYNTSGGVNKFKTSHGTVVEVKGGDYGSSLSANDLADKAIEAFLNKGTVEAVAKYSQNVLDPNVKGIGESYIEVDLTNQYVYVYIDGNLVVETPCVTGLPTAARTTPQGIYMLKNKMMDVPLVGDNYVTPVKYWMPFNGGIGLHDAVWQSKFGGTIYKSKGSHGCVNLPMDKAAEIYKNAIVKMPVICYYHDRIDSFQSVPSTGPVMGQYRSLTASERTMLNNIKNGRAPGAGAVFDSVPAVKPQTNANTTANPGTDSTNTDENNNQIIIDQIITPSAVE